MLTLRAAAATQKVTVRFLPITEELTTVKLRGYGLDVGCELRDVLAPRYIAHRAVELPAMSM